MVTSVGTGLIDRLTEYQRYWRLSDHKFAERLGISSQLWQMTRTGKRDIGLSVLKGVMRAYPELEQDVTLFLRGDVDTMTSLVGSPTDDHQQPPAQYSGVFRGVFDKVHRFLFSRSKAGKVEENDSAQ